MGRRGPAPKPARLKLLRGNPGKRSLKEGPKARPVRPNCPSWLPAEAKAEWRRLAPQLERLGLLTQLDRAAFACFCVSYAHWRQCQQVIAEQSAMYVTASGRLRERPEVAMAKQFGRLMRDFAVELGLTPNSRSRFSLPSPISDEDAEFEELLDG